jgi:hypothetical protein
MNSLPGLPSNCSPPDFCLLRSWDYRREPVAPGSKCFFFFFGGMGFELRALFSLRRFSILGPRPVFCVFNICFIE